MEILSSGVVNYSYTLMFLALLREQDMYGYDMVKVLAEKSGGYFSIKTSDAYQHLYRLEGESLISRRNVLVGDKRSRNYFHLESEGYAFLDMAAAEYKKLYDETMHLLRMCGVLIRDEGQGN